MKKRKMLSLFLVGCLAAGTLAGCGGKSNVALQKNKKQIENRTEK